MPPLRGLVIILCPWAINIRLLRTQRLQSQLLMNNTENRIKSPHPPLSGKPFPPSADNIGEGADTMGDGTRISRRHLLKLTAPTTRARTTRRRAARHRVAGLLSETWRIRDRFGEFRERDALLAYTYRTPARGRASATEELRRGDRRPAGRGFAAGTRALRTHDARRTAQRGREFSGDVRARA